MSRAEILEAMMRGFEPIENYLEVNPLSEERWRQIAALARGVAKYREYLTLTGGIFERSRVEFEADHRAERLKARGTRTATSDGEHYLTSEECSAFEADGWLGPFNVLSPAEAQDLYEYSRRLHETNFEGNLYISEEHEAVMRRADLWSLDYSGWYQALNFKPLWDVFASPEIAHRVASLMGDDLICWRTQFFEKAPGEQGSFWHQTDTFRELSGRPKLVPTREATGEMVNLSVWIALTDATVENGCMRILPGSFRDNRLEAFSYHIAQDPVPYLLAYDDSELEQRLGCLLFGSLFQKTQVLLEMATRHFEDLFDGRPPRDIEMKAGDFFIFTSMNVHGSYPNTTDRTRLAMVGRYTNNDVKVMPGFETDVVPTPEGNYEYPLDRVGCFQVHGEDTCHWNRIIPYRW